MSDWRLPSSSYKSNKDDTPRDEIPASPHIPQSNPAPASDFSTVDRGKPAGESAPNSPLQGYQLDSVTTLLHQPHPPSYTDAYDHQTTNTYPQEQPTTSSRVSMRQNFSDDLQQSNSNLEESARNDGRGTTRSVNQGRASRFAEEAQATGHAAAGHFANRQHVASGENIFRRPEDRASEYEPRGYSYESGAARPEFGDPSYADSSAARQMRPTIPRVVDDRQIYRVSESPVSSPPVDTSVRGERTTRGMAATSTLASVYQRADSGPRVQSVRRSLEDAVEAWWTESSLPSKALLRNGLLVLEAGHSLDEAYRTLLLRTALRYRRGMVTALKHQTDPDRSAYLLKEALLFEKNPLPTEALWTLQTEDQAAEEWMLLLDDDLRYHLDSFGPKRRRLAAAAVHQLGSQRLVTPEKTEEAVKIVTSVSRSFSWTAGRFLLLLLLIPALVGIYSLRAQRADLTGMASIPSGQYTIGSPSSGSAEEFFELTNGFAIEQIEVTNQSYRLCVQQGICAEPSEISSATHLDYYVNPLYSQYPIINVDWFMARQYCEWAGKRLPTVDEWEIAASAAPATGRRFEYPWGDTFLPQRANSDIADIGDTKAVGTYHSGGTSSTGATDMAGNVAEWTTKRGSIEVYNVKPEQTFTVKGGSYKDPQEMLGNSVGVNLPSHTTAPWIGFRCAITLPAEPES